ncbi:hypothetical protein [Alicyclobacillus tolerans]|uniref:hypothetical protein n=1 Tax=Alicyclobacillus tolerans TaxID=90970 RepID=UPI0009339AD1|nr:hypothetical protein [Alicyclobacillus montanus]
MRFIIEQSDEVIVTHSGMALIGLLLEKTRIGERLNQTRLDGMGTPEILNRDIAHAFIGLLCQGKTDFDHIEPFREDDYFLDALQIQSVPSSPTLRQRIDMAAGNDSDENITFCHAQDSKSDFIIKRNLRKEYVDACLITVQQTSPALRCRGLLSVTCDWSGKPKAL